MKCAQPSNARTPLHKSRPRCKRRKRRSPGATGAPRQRPARSWRQTTARRTEIHPHQKHHQRAPAHGPTPQPRASRVPAPAIAAHGEQQRPPPPQTTGSAAAALGPLPMRISRQTTAPPRQGRGLVDQLQHGGPPRATTRWPRVANILMTVDSTSDTSSKSQRQHGRPGRAGRSGPCATRPCARAPGRATTAAPAPTAAPQTRRWRRQQQHKPAIDASRPCAGAWALARPPHHLGARSPHHATPGRSGCSPDRPCPPTSQADRR